MRRSRLTWWSGAVAVAVLAATACGNDDGKDVRSTTAGASGSGSGTGSGIVIDTSKTSGDPAVAEAVARYEAYVKGQVATLVGVTKTFTDAVRAGDVEAAKAAFAISRYPWEAIEPIAGLVSDIDGAVDARVDDFASEDDPAWTGWHKLEYLLWVKGDISDATGAPQLADQLDQDLANLQSDVATLSIPPAALPSGAAELIEEVSSGKITGEEDRYSHTDLSDFAANVTGSERAYELLEPAIAKKDPDLVAEIDQGFAEIDAQLEKYRQGSGYQSFEALTDADQRAMKATLAALSESLSQVGGVLGLE
jgi:iron uptake system component EfeO